MELMDDSLGSECGGDGAVPSAGFVQITSGWSRSW